MKNGLLALMAWVQNAAASERGQWNAGGGFGLIALIIIIIVFIWLLIRARILNLN